MEILLIEANSQLAKKIGDDLQAAGLQTQWVLSLEQAWTTLQKAKPDLIIAEINSQDRVRWEFLSKILASPTRPPMIILTEEADEEASLKSLEQGANDVVKLPISSRELLLRIKLLLKTTKPIQSKSLGGIAEKVSTATSEIQYANLVISPLQRKITIGQQPFELNRREFDIFLHLIENADRIISRNSLLSLIDLDGKLFDRTVDSHISHLRIKLRDFGATQIKISSVYGLGYRFEKSDI